MLLAGAGSAVAQGVTELGISAPLVSIRPVDESALEPEALTFSDRDNAPAIGDGSAGWTGDVGGVGVGWHHWVLNPLQPREALSMAEVGVAPTVLAGVDFDQAAVIQLDVVFEDYSPRGALDDVMFYQTVMAVPEPSLIGVGVGALLMLALRRTR